MRKCKFDLFHFLVRTNNILYSSKGHRKKYIAFIIIEISNLDNATYFLNEVLKNGMLEYYSVQISLAQPRTKYIILCAQAGSKEILIKHCNIVRRNINEYLESENINHRFLMRASLKKKFLEIIYDKLKIDLKVKKDMNGIFLDDGMNKKRIKVYRLKFFKDFTDLSSLAGFVNNLIDLRINAYLIFNFDLSKGNVIFTPYFVEHVNDLSNTPILSQKLDEFPLYSVSINELKVNSNLLGRILWRLPYFDYQIIFDELNTVLMNFFSRY